MNDVKGLIENKIVWLLYILAGLLTLIVTYYQLIIGSLLLVILVVLIYNTYKIEDRVRKRTESYISTLSYRIKKVGDEAFLGLPFGIILYNEDFKIEWSNPYINELIDQEKSLIGEELSVLSSSLDSAVAEEKQEIEIVINDRSFLAVIRPEDRLIYLFDRTEKVELQKLYENDKTVLAVIFLDNYEELTQAMDDTSKSQLNSEVTSMLNNWSNEYGIYLKRTSQERFLAIMNEEILKKLEKNKFEILDSVKEMISNQNVPLTLSIGIGRGIDNLPKLGELAQSSLDLALGRGGDQVVIKDTTSKVKFFGGKTNPMEKRTRVRARVISHALKELVRESDHVLIMGHKSPDMDSIGSCIGILKLTQQNQKNGYIVFDPDGVNTGVEKLMEEIEQDPELAQWFITPEQSLDIITKDSLIIIVDTHKPSMVMEERLLNKTDHVVVIDHHRRSEDFVEDPILVYMEPYASSTAELVTELLEYQEGPVPLTTLEATSLLAGITVDTKSFTLRTGSRTFDAASYLRSKGADTILVQKLLKEDLDEYVKRADLVKNATIYREGIAIATGDEDTTYNPITLAQAADTLLTMNGVKASFVVALRKDGQVGVSARSLGEINVQIIMERMNGGGHLTNAATQLEDTTMEQVVDQLRDIIEEYFEGGDES